MRDAQLEVRLRRRGREDEGRFGHHTQPDVQLGDGVVEDALRPGRYRVPWRYGDAIAPGHVDDLKLTTVVTQLL